MGRGDMAGRIGEGRGVGEEVTHIDLVVVRHRLTGSILPGPKVS